MRFQSLEEPIFHDHFWERNQNIKFVLVFRLVPSFFGTVSNNVSDIFSTISAPIPHDKGNHIGIKKNFFEYSQAPK